MHVIGAGVAGLSCAVALVKAGRRVRVHEAAGLAGGRCRSYHDAALGRVIDNGNHLLLSGNRAVHAYLADIGASEELAGPERASYAFLDLGTDTRWTVRPNAGPIPWWIWMTNRRVPDTRPGDYLQGLRLAWAGRDATVIQCLGADRVLYRRFWEPLAVAVLNTRAEAGSARLLWPVFRETFGRGEAACRPRVARAGLSRCFVDPALAWLRRNGCTVELNQRLRAIALGDRAEALDFGGEPVKLAEGDSVVLAVTPSAAAALVPGLVTPERSNAIVNGHFVIEGGRREATILGIIGGTCQWLFVRDDIASVTISAAGGIADESAETIARRMWPEVARALNLGDAPLPPHRIVKEKRATFDQTPDQAARRPGAVTAWRNLFLAGDWTDTGLPATIEGALRSGHKAAGAVVAPATNP